MSLWASTFTNHVNPFPLHWSDSSLVYSKRTKPNKTLKTNTRPVDCCPCLPNSNKRVEFSVCSIFVRENVSTTNKLVRVRCAIIFVIFLQGVNELHADQVKSNGLFYATRVALHAFCTDILENRVESVCESARALLCN